MPLSQVLARVLALLIVSLPVSIYINQHSRVSLEVSKMAARILNDPENNMNHSTTSMLLSDVTKSPNPDHPWSLLLDSVKSIESAHNIELSKLEDLINRYIDSSDLSSSIFIYNIDTFKTTNDLKYWILKDMLYDYLIDELLKIINPRSYNFEDIKIIPGNVEYTKTAMRVQLTTLIPYSQSRYRTPLEIIENDSIVGSEFPFYYPRDLENLEIVSINPITNNRMAYEVK